MNVLLTSILAVFISPPVFAAQKAYDLNLVLNLKGEKIMAPNLVVKEGQTAFLSIKDDATKEETFLQVFARDKDGKNIQIDCVVGKMIKGKMTVISKPGFIARENEKAEIQVGDYESETAGVQLSVIAKRTTF